MIIHQKRKTHELVARASCKFLVQNSESEQKVEIKVQIKFYGSAHFLEYNFVPKLEFFLPRYKKNFRDAINKKS